MSKVFLDTNIIIYANDARDPLKHARAIDIVARAMSDRSGVLSTQVLQEYAAIAGTRLRQAVDVIQRQLLLLECLEVVYVSPSLVRRALELQFRYQVQFWDASILAAAELAQCPRILSEDLNPGQVYANVRVENPLQA